MPRECNETKRTSITGIDGSGKSSVAQYIVRIFGSKVPVASIGSLGSPSFITGPSDKKTPLFSSLSRECKQMYNRGQEQDRRCVGPIGNSHAYTYQLSFCRTKDRKNGSTSDCKR